MYKIYKMINIEIFENIEKLLEKQKELERIVEQIKQNRFDKNKTFLQNISSSFKFENIEEFEIIRNSINDIVKIRLENVREELNLYKIIKIDE
jgi:hypothetical protein